MIRALVLFAALAAANVYQASVSRVIDGDTVEVRVIIWPQIETTTAIRILGIDTPELKGKCEIERSRAQEAKVFLERLLPPGTQATIKNLKPDKFAGRYDAEVWTSDGKSAAQELISSGLARAYSGGKRQGWC